jgi:hypothetical protein
VQAATRPLFPATLEKAVAIPLSGKTIISILFLIDIMFLVVMQACIANKVLEKMKISFVFVALIGLTFIVIPKKK